MIDSPAKHFSVETFHVGAAKLVLAAKHRDGTTERLFEAEKSYDTIALNRLRRRRWWFFHSSEEEGAQWDIARNKLEDAKRAKDNADEAFAACVTTMSLYDAWDPMLRDKCTVTGVAGYAHQVGTAYLLPPCSAPVYFQKFDFADCDDPKNTILLCANIERAYSKERLCFEITDLGTFTMKIWDPKIRTMPIFSGSHRLIGEFEQVEFAFPEDKMPGTKLLSFHAQCSYQKAVNVGWITTRRMPPIKYGSPLTNDLLYCRMKNADQIDSQENNSLTGGELPLHVARLSISSKDVFKSRERLAL